MKHLDAPNPGCTPKHDINCKLSLKSDWLIEILFQYQQRLFQEHFVLSESRSP